MELRGQGELSDYCGNSHGYAMAVLLVGMSIMAVLMGAALPVWNKQAQREREEEYLFRATEYARAIQKFQRRAGPGTLPPNFDVLVDGRFLRRKYKDPITSEDFQPIFQTVTAPGQPAGGARPGVPVPPAQATPSTPTGGTPTSAQGIPVPGAGVIGVVSKSKATSIKVYNGRTRYDQWAVTYQDVKPGKGLPPDLLQALNAAAGAAQGQPSAPGQPLPLGQPPGGGLFGQPPGAAPFGAPGGPPGAAPFGGPPRGPGTVPFGGPSAPPPAGGPGIFAPAYPPPPGATGAPIFAPPPRKMP